ncbi:response regulator [Pseudoalteromonas luteoviolacea]|uniref:hybrid sensor histidine kinase/response regulator n=1 Tax=Pseudoalteromonas luteoviolacea TaxID=43657 RepID=UPI001B3959E6|nr:ATP-binding protein [Pseudoalteromonas luteoviolacea]MBQ4810223.1 response regulator [Pseudoalteromonas luteoviolacea]
MEGSIPFLVTDKALLIKSISPAAVELLGCKEVLGLSVQALLNLELDKVDSAIGCYKNRYFKLYKYGTTNGYSVVLQKCNTVFDEGSFLADAINSANIGLWRYNLDSKHVYLSDITKQFLGIEDDVQVTWRQLICLVHKDDRALFPLFFENHAQFGVPLQFEFRLKSAGQKRWFALKGSLAKRGALQWINGTLQDCTIEKNTVIALNDADESKQLAIEAGKIGTWRATKSGNLWRWKWDMLANTIFKLEPKDIGDLNKWVELLHPEDRPKVLAALDESLKTGIEFKQHYRSILKNGDVIYVFAQGRVGKNYKGEHCRIDGVCIDQTEIHKAQQALKELNTELETRVNDRTAELHNTLQKAERANKVKSEFLSMISHELRTPLNGIIGALDLLAHCQLTSESKDLVYTASTSANHLITILNDLLDLNKIEAGKLELETVVFELPTLVSEVVSTFAASAKEKGISLNIYEDLAQLQPLKGDENRFRQILLNILGNAIKFTNTHGVKQKHITLNAQFKQLNIYQGEVTISISDTGVGMSKETINKLFTPFTQAEKSTTRKFGGTGLGLSICGKLIDLMGGQIIVESELHKGSVFTIKAPFWLDISEREAREKTPLACYVVGQLSFDNAHLLKLVHAFYDVTLCELNSASNINAMPPAQLHLVLSSEIDSMRFWLPQLEQLPNLIVYTDASLQSQFALSFVQLAVYPNQPLTAHQLCSQLEAQQQEQLNMDDFTFDAEPLDKTVESGTCGHDILLVEDNPFNQKLIKNQLEKLGFHCDVASNGAEGFNFWHSHHYKLILTDCHMPEVDGYEMTKQIRTEEAKSEQPPVPIIAVTGAVMQGEKDMCTSIGMNDFLCKPVRLTDIKLIMERWYEHSA